MCVCVTEVRMCIFNAFISSANIHLQHKTRLVQHNTCSSLAINMFVCSVISLLEVSIAETNSSLAMNAYICSVISYSEVSSRGYLVASDKHIHLQCDIMEMKQVVFESWFGNSLKGTENREKVSEINFLSS